MKNSSSDLRLAAASLPEDLLAQILQRVCGTLDTPDSLAPLLRLACTCQHWRTAAAVIASQQRRPSLVCYTITPLLSCLTQTWSSLHLILDARGAPAGLTAFMQSCTASTKVTLSGRGTEEVNVDAVQRALFSSTTTVKELHCLSFRPIAFPSLLQILDVGLEMTWTGSAMESMFRRLQWAPLLAFVNMSIDMDRSELVLSARHVSDIRLPSLQKLRLHVYGFAAAISFDLSWLSAESRTFILSLHVFAARQDDGLLGLSRSVQPLLHSQDDFTLDGLQGVCADAQVMLSQLKLNSFWLSVRWSEVITHLPPAEQISLNFMLLDSDMQTATLTHGSSNTPSHFCSHVDWSTLICAQKTMKITLRDFATASQTHTTELHVARVPAAPGAESWQASLLSPFKPWRLRCEDWGLVSGLPPATCHKPGPYTMENQAALKLGQDALY